MKNMGMMEYPLMFRIELIPRILEGIKDVTRRVIARQPAGTDIQPFYNEKLRRGIFHSSDADRGWSFSCPYGRPGDTLWVKETFAKLEDLRTKEPRFKVLHKDHKALYKAEYPTDRLTHDDGTEMKWRPAIFMPRNLSRIDLLNKATRIEHIQDITEQQALRDGGWEYKNCPFHKAPIKSFKYLWDDINAQPKPRYRKINGKKEITHYDSYPWMKGTKTKTFRGKPWYVYGNPWIFVVEFDKKNQ